MLPFALQAVSDSPTPAALALAIAAELEPVALDAAEDELDELACELAPFRHATPREQLVASAAAVADRFGPAREQPRVTREHALDDLLLHRVLRRGSGHPLPLAIAAVDAGRRAGIPLGVVGCDREQYLAHRALATPHVADLRARGPLADLAARETRVGWRCAHQLAAVLLTRVAERAERVGRLGWAIHAAELRLALPLGPDTRERMERDVARLRARLN